MFSCSRLTASLSLFLACGAFTAQAALAQTFIGESPQNLHTVVKNSSMLKPPAGTRVAIVEWEDLECPACAQAFPVVHQAADHYRIPIVRHDFMIPGHMWSRDAEIFARYLQDTVKPPEIATDYRRQVFASQFRIASKDDLQMFTQQFMKAHSLPMPFVVDPTGKFAHEVQADHDLGLELGLVHTPTIMVVTPKHWIEVLDVMQLYTALDQAEAEVGKDTAPNAKRPASVPRK